MENNLLLNQADVRDTGRHLGRVRVSPLVRPGAPVSYTVVDGAAEPIPEIEAFLLHLVNLNRAPATVRNYAYTLQLLFRWLNLRSLTPFSISLDQLAEFFLWFQNQAPTARLVESASSRGTKTIKSKLTLKGRRVEICAFYRFHALRHPSSETLALLGGLNRRWGSQVPVIETRTRDSWRITRGPRPKTVTDEQVTALLAACSTYRDRFLVHLLDQSGLRVGEALGLRHADLDVRRSFVHVVPRQENVNGARAKGAKSRTVPVPASVFDSYARYMTEEYLEITSDYVFVHLSKSYRGTPQTSTSASKMIKTLQDRTNIPFSSKMTRHSYATRLIRAGVALEVVADLLGHASVVETQKTYIHLQAEDHRRVLVSAGILVAEGGARHR